jgi:hypothetical protein
MVKSADEEIPRREKHEKHDKHDKKQEEKSEGRKKTKPARTLSAGNPFPEGGPSDSTTSEGTLITIPESTHKKKIQRKPPRFLPLDSIEATKKKPTIYSETARSARRRKSMGPEEPELEIFRKSRREPRRGHTVDTSNSSPVIMSSVTFAASTSGSTASPATTTPSTPKSLTVPDTSSSANTPPAPLTRTSSSDADSGVKKERRPRSKTRNVRRAKSDSTLAMGRINTKHEIPPPRPKFEDLKKLDGLAGSQDVHSLAKVVEKEEPVREDLVYKMENGRMTLVLARFESIMDLVLNTECNLGL